MYMYIPFQSPKILGAPPSPTEKRLQRLDTFTKIFHENVGPKNQF